MTREEQISNGFTEMMKGFWGNQDLKVPDFEEPCKQEPCEDKRLYIKVFADLEPDDIAEKIYQICDEDKFPKVIESLKEYFDYETCEDTISRKAVLDYIDKMPSELTTDGRRMIRRRTLEEYISDTLPSVIPQQKVGKWMIHPNGVYAHLVCSKCLTNAPYDCKTNYCPNCGAKMEVE